MSLRERRDVVKLHRETVHGVLFTIVRTMGSSYRKPGARMLTTQDGRSAGSISGGCLAAEILRRAAWTARDGAAMEHVSTLFDDTAEMPYGNGCGGEIDLLVEPADTEEAAALMDALEATLQGEARIVATVVPAQDRALTRIVIDPARNVIFASELLPTETIVDLRAAALTAAHGAYLEIAAAGTVFVERLPAAQRLILFGASDDAKPLTRLAAEMGWTVIVADGHAQLARPEMFPAADEVVIATSAVELPVRPDDAVVIMTHAYEQDRSLLTELLPMRLPYLGLLGAKHRSALLLSEAAAACGMSLAEAVERVHAPIGLKLGGDGPEAVALDIVSELQHTLTMHTQHPGSRRMSAAEVEHILTEGAHTVIRTNMTTVFTEVTR